MPNTSALGTRAIPRRRFVAALAAVAALTTATACGSGGNAAKEVAAPNTIVEGAAPSYYPASYATDVIEASKKEGGTLTIYSNTSEENWAPIFRDFQKKYPWIKKLAANDLDSDEVFQKVLSEQSTGSSPVDLTVSNASSAWAEFAQRPGTLMAYTSPELAKLPSFATLLPNVYAMSADPMTIAYNTTLVPKAPTSMKDLADMVKADAATFKGKVTVRDPESSFGFTVTKAFTDANPAGWSALESILPSAKPETSSGTQLEKLVSGEYAAGFFISGGPAFPVVEDSDGLVKVVYPKDGTTVLPRGIGIAAKAPHPATAKLFLDFVLSDEGQRAVAEGGLSSYRDGISGTGLHTYQELVSEVGEANVIFVKYAKVSKSEISAFQSRFNGLVSK